MALGVSAYSEAAFSAEPNDIIVHPTGIALTSTMGEESNVADANVSVTGIQATFTNAGAVAGSSVLFSVTGSELTTSIGEETIDIGVTVTGQELSISNLTFTQDTLTAFGQAPFATQSPSEFKIPSVTIEATVGAGTITGFELQSTLGTFSVQADGNVSVVVTEHTMNTSVGSVANTGDALVEIANGGGPEFTALADAQLSNAENKFGGTSLKLDGSSDRIQSTDVTLGADSFTWETFAYFNNFTSTQCIWDAGENVGASQNPVVFITSTNIQISYAGGTYINVAHGMSASQWHHIAIVRDGTQLEAFIDGVSKATATLGSIGAGATNHVLGGNFAGTFTMDGFLDESRLTKRVIYTGNFTPPTGAFSVDANDIWLLHYDGTNGSTDIVNSVNDGAIFLTSSIGSESAFTDHTVEVTGQQLTTSMGEEVPTGDAVVTVTGSSLTSSVGDVSVTGNANISLTGISGTLTLGTPTATPNSLIDVTGNQLTTFIGQVITFDANAEVTGISATMSIGSVKTTTWQEIDPGVSNVWTEVDLAA